MTSRLSSICPACRRIVPRGRQCVCGYASPAARQARQPYRAAYRDPAYRRNRLARYRMAEGRCESCGVPLAGELWHTGVMWECDHVREVKDFADPRTANAVENLRVLCVSCHKDKTAGRKRI